MMNRIRNVACVVCMQQRAQEMQQADPKVAYYCRMYAVEQVWRFMAAAMHSSRR